MRLSTFENVELLGRYNTSCFMSKAEGTDLALFYLLGLRHIV